MPKPPGPRVTLDQQEGPLFLCFIPKKVSVLTRHLPCLQDNIRNVLIEVGDNAVLTKLSLCLSLLLLQGFPWKLSPTVFLPFPLIFNIWLMIAHHTRLRSQQGVCRVARVPSLPFEPEELWKDFLINMRSS